MRGTGQVSRTFIKKNGVCIYRLSVVDYLAVGDKSCWQFGIVFVVERLK